MVLPEPSSATNAQMVKKEKTLCTGVMIFLVMELITILVIIFLDMGIKKLKGINSMFDYLKFQLTSGKVRFFNPDGKEGELFSYSSELEKIGSGWDVHCPNGIYVEIVSEPMIIDRPKYGGIISVTKIRDDVATDYHTIVKEFWVPTIYLSETKDEG
jgi:hypothetical protein